MMKSSILVMIAILLNTAILSASTYDSIFGLSVDLPTGWQVMHRQTVNDSSAAKTTTEAAPKDSRKNAEQNGTGCVKEMVEAGNIEYFVNTSCPGCVISVTAGTGRVPSTPAETRRMCHSLPRDLSRSCGKRIKVHACKAKEISGMAAFYTSFDGFKSGTQSFQYQLQKSPDQILVVNATCPEESCGIVSSQLEKMVESIQFR